jgi:hypothetical protein
VLTIWLLLEAAVALATGAVAVVLEVSALLHRLQFQADQQSP